MSSLESALSFSVIKSVENISARWVLSYAVLFSKTSKRSAGRWKKKITHQRHTIVSAPEQFSFYRSTKLSACLISATLVLYRGRLAGQTMKEKTPEPCIMPSFLHRARQKAA
jgi:hypothetical protein